MDPKNLTVDQAICYLPKNVAREYIERQAAGDLDDNFLALVKDYLKPKGIAYERLVKLDRRYFKPQDEDREMLTREQATYRLTTWMFDHEGDEPNCRKKLKSQLPEIYVDVLEHFVDGDHDT